MEFYSIPTGAGPIKPIDIFLERILASREKINHARKTIIKFSEPIISLNDLPVIFPRTINVIQGKAGVHKSRLAETFCSVILRHPSCNKELLGFRANSKHNYAVCYVDTERNLLDQFPFALQQILNKAGHPIDAELCNFEYISLLEFERKDRFNALESYIDYVRNKYAENILIVLDVITDCILNFNDTTESLKLIDLMNNCINTHDVTFLCLIHENPGVGSEKARGHLGTELANKATTVIQTGFEKDRKDLLKIQFLKCRSSRRHDPLYAIYDETERGLVLADSSLVQDALDSKRNVARIEDVKRELKILLTGPLTKQELLDHLKTDLKCGVRILEDRLKEILEQRLEIQNMAGVICHLQKFKQDRSNQLSYKLTPNQHGTESEIPFSE